MGLNSNYQTDWEMQNNNNECSYKQTLPGYLMQRASGEITPTHEAKHVGS